MATASARMAASAGGCTARAVRLLAPPTSTTSPAIISPAVAGSGAAAIGPKSWIAFRSPSEPTGLDGLPHGVLLLAPRTMRSL